MTQAKSLDFWTSQKRFQTEDTVKNKGIVSMDCGILLLETSFHPSSSSRKEICGEPLIVRLSPFD